MVGSLAPVISRLQVSSKGCVGGGSGTGMLGLFRRLAKLCNSLAPVIIQYCLRDGCMPSEGCIGGGCVDGGGCNRLSKKKSRRSPRSSDDKYGNVLVNILLVRSQFRGTQGISVDG